MAVSNREPFQKCCKTSSDAFNFLFSTFNFLLSTFYFQLDKLSTFNLINFLLSTCNFLTLNCS